MESTSAALGGGAPGDSFARNFWQASAMPGTDALPDPDSADSMQGWAVFGDLLPTLCWVARGDGYIFWYNRRWHDYCGSTPAQMEGWGWQSVHDPAQLPLVMERWQASIASGEPFEVVFPLRGADGVYRPFLTRVVPVHGPDGSVARWFGTNSEIDAQLAAEAALRDSEAKFETLTDAMPQMVWSTLPDGYHDYFNAQWYHFTGVPPGSTDGEAWAGMFHPEDQPRAQERWQRSLATGEPYEVEYRLRRHDGAWRWTLGRAMAVRNAAGEIIRWIGTCTDIQEQKRIADENELLSRELAHRIKNIFAVIAGLIGLSSRRQPESKGFAQDIGARIAALGRAHDFARPHSELSRPELGTTTLTGLIDELMAPYQDVDSPRVHISGDSIAVDDRGATPLALLFHELATNSAKYGALSADGGQVAIHCTLDSGEIVVTWRETGGPRISGEPTSRGFGSMLADISVVQQLGGTLSRKWHPEGLEVEMRVSAARLSRT